MLGPSGVCYCLEWLSPSFANAIPQQYLKIKFVLSIDSVKTLHLVSFSEKLSFTRSIRHMLINFIPICKGTTMIMLLLLYITVCTSAVVDQHLPIHEKAQHPYAMLPQIPASLTIRCTHGRKFFARLQPAGVPQVLFRLLVYWPAMCTTWCSSTCWCVGFYKRFAPPPPPPKKKCNNK